MQVDVTHAGATARSGRFESVAAPAVLGPAIHDALSHGRVRPSAVRALLVACARELGLAGEGSAQRLSLDAYLAIILVLGLVRAASSGSYRFGLYRSAYQIETDLRSTT